ncbi:MULTISPECIES: heavy metal-responsive transcriptional regulator [Cyanophyceae]|uniref:heavy metal-responsive transcriptional regulator n=1 Tax=Cyanophyceae TaxID=3028117 RepID=UPI001688E780|nr:MULTISPECIES: heavy metal-responsive transcriptional regulator [Cyanophyceae]MBD1916998.1 heavy metal-responsive transcriptional regulator [Phormidium sp. FACHB-77]MBD2029849.1 heavy metal-responsive transcriptional regulator [Phormidium sp. FACHB-322]MBD2050363.1 heavy metal-responsive transcriptional regulator [Leptolyngbya sp. FACHB-60]
MTVATRLKIGDVAKQTGIAVGALRYYESLGLLHSERGDNGYRYYSPTAVHQVQFIKKAQALGFSLEDVGDVLNVHQRGDVPCGFVRSLLQDKIQQLEDQIQQMTAFKADLENYRDRWAETQPRPQPGDICPLIETVPLTA